MLSGQGTRTAATMINASQPKEAELTIFLAMTLTAVIVTTGKWLESLLRPLNRIDFRGSNLMSEVLVDH